MVNKIKFINVLENTNKYIKSQRLYKKLFMLTLYFFPQLQKLDKYTKKFRDTKLFKTSAKLYNYLISSFISDLICLSCSIGIIIGIAAASGSIVIPLACLGVTIAGHAFDLYNRIRNKINKDSIESELLYLDDFKKHQQEVIKLKKQLNIDYTNDKQKYYHKNNIKPPSKIRSRLIAIKKNYLFPILGFIGSVLSFNPNLVLLTNFFSCLGLYLSMKTEIIEQESKSHILNYIQSIKSEAPTYNSLEGLAQIALHKKAEFLALQEIAESNVNTKMDKESFDQLVEKKKKLIINENNPLYNSVKINTEKTLFTKIKNWFKSLGHVIHPEYSPKTYHDISLQIQKRENNNEIELTEISKLKVQEVHLQPTLNKIKHQNQQIVYYK